MVFEKLSESLKGTLKKIAKSLYLDKKLVDEALKDIQRTLISSDVDVKLVFELTKRLRKKVLEEKTPEGLTKKEHLIKTIYNELVALLGEKGYKINVNKKSFKILLCGLFGSGKTTSIAKVAKFFQKRGYKVCALGTDTWRPAAQDQLEQLGDQVNIKTFIDKKEKNPIKIIKKYENEWKKFNIVLIDTAGRDALDKKLAKELKEISSYLKPEEKILVMPADIGQEARKQAEKFHELVGITGVIVTRLDSTAKGGGALSACSVAKVPVKFIGVGEHMSDLEEFEPKRFVSRLLGMGDLETLLEKAKEAIEGEVKDEKELEDMESRILSGKFNLLDLYEQLETVKKMGPLNKIMDMIPGLGMANIPKDMLNVQESALKKYKYMFDSMTEEELMNPNIITSSRVSRIAKGSGVDESDVRDLLKKYNQIKKVVKMLGGRSLKRLAKSFKGGAMLKNLKSKLNM